jgi:hypothetical protein
MAQRLSTVLRNFSRSLQECRQLGADAHDWSLPGAHGARPYIYGKRRDSMTEIAFLRAFLAWEMFVEHSFILYLSGQKPPRGRAPRRYAFPPNQETASRWVIPERRPYAEWTDPQDVLGRSERFFHHGRPFAPVLRSNVTMLQEAKVIRNAIAHMSQGARQKFENLVRQKLTTLPPKTTVGGFLSTTIPTVGPPISFLEFYIAKIEFTAQQIVPS